MSFVQIAQAGPCGKIAGGQAGWFAQAFREYSQSLFAEVTSLHSHIGILGPDSCRIPIERDSR